MKKKFLIISLFFVLIIGGVALAKIIFGSNNSEKKIEQSSSKISEASLSSSEGTSSSQETSSESNPEGFVPTNEQEEDAKTVDEVGDDAIAKGREELKAAGYNPTDFSASDIAGYIKKSKSEGKKLVEIIKNEGIMP